MFKKPDESRAEPTIHGGERSAPPTTRGRAAATIGPSIHVNGDVTGREDLVIEGRVEGNITLEENVLTVGKEGTVNATVNARAIYVEGNVEGDLRSDEQVVIRAAGNVRGNIVAPRVTLEDGCKFKGSIDMDVEPGTASRGGPGRSEKIADIKSASSGSGDSSSGGVLGNAPGQ